MTMKDELVKLLYHASCESELEGQIGSCPYRKNGRCGEVERLDLCAVQHLADHIIANGVTIQRWIPVAERLPEENGRYLCNVKSFAFPGCFYQAILQCDKHGFREGNIYTEDVTHWMPLPEPPKGE